MDDNFDCWSGEDHHYAGERKGCGSKGPTAKDVNVSNKILLASHVSMTYFQKYWILMPEMLTR